MKIFRGINSIHRANGSVATIGVFDGVHRGHRAVIKKVVERARALGTKSVVVTFDPHPSKVLRKGRAAPSLISLEHRIRLIEELGVDILVILAFTDELARCSAEKFVKRILVNGLGVKEVYIGENFFFGRGARAGASRLRLIAGATSVTVKAVPFIRTGGKTASSSLVRKLIFSGRIGMAKRVLGRPVAILGTVVPGSGLARGLGYPTANINPHHEVIPPRGVYAVNIRYGGKSLGGVLNIGWKPTFFSPRDREPTIEVHIFDFRRKIYGRVLEMLFVKKIRNEIRFKGREPLVRQIRRDVAAARRILRPIKCSIPRCCK